MRWVADGKYASTGRPLTVIRPSPGSVLVRRRTRATACLRRPVDWTRGLGTDGTPEVLGSAAGAGHLVGGGLLGGVGMGGAGVDLELRQLLAAEGALGE